MSQRLDGVFSELAPRIERATAILLCVGFDGALAPIDERPDEVRLAHRVRESLRALAQLDRVNLAVFSGRERDDLAHLVDLPRVILVGNHGLQIAGPGLLFVEPTAAQFGDQIQQLSSDLAERLREIPGVIVENKGLTVTVHIRTTPQPLHEQVRKIVHSALANASHPFLLREGRMTYDIRPRAYWNKGHAVVWLRDQIDGEGLLTIYIGSDNTDEDAFTAIGDAITIKVGDPTTTAAKYYVDGPKAVHEFLHWLVEELAHAPQI
jgi:trehalose 6-phosphate phosphatase